MTTMVTEIYDALRSVGVDSNKAKSAAESVVAKQDDIATKQYIALSLAELKADLMKWTVGIMLAMTGMFAAIVKLF